MTYLDSIAIAQHVVLTLQVALLLGTKIVDTSGGLLQYPITKSDEGKLFVIKVCFLHLRNCFTPLPALPRLHSLSLYR